MAMRYVFITDELPRSGAAGHLALNHAVIAWLQGLGHDVVVLLVGARLAFPVERYGLAPVAGPFVFGMGGFVVARSPVVAFARGLVWRLPAGWVAWLRGARNGADAVLGRFLAPKEVDWCAGYMARAKPDAVLIDTMFRAGVLADARLEGVNSLIITHDLFFRRHQALVSAGYRVRPERLTREAEAALLGQARHIAAMQPAEGQILKEMCPARHVFALAMPALPVPPPAGVARVAGRLVFIGSATLPNLDGLRWFLADIWPLLQGRGITLDLIGQCGPAFGALPKGVRRLGRVKNLAPALHRAMLAISPLRVGSGLKIKLLDYARHGLVTVATPASLEGFAADEAAPFIAAAGAADFARAIIKRLAEPAGTEAALAYVARHYGERVSFAGLSSALLP